RLFFGICAGDIRRSAGAARGEEHGNPGAASLLALQLYLRAVVLGGVLDYGEAEAGAAGGAGVALVHAVEALEHPGAVLGRDAYAVVGDGEGDAAGGSALHRHGDVAAVAAVLDGVVAEVPDYLPEQAADAEHAAAAAAHGD